MRGKIISHVLVDIIIDVAGRHDVMSGTTPSSKRSSHDTENEESVVGTYREDGDNSLPVDEASNIQNGAVNSKEENIDQEKYQDRQKDIHHQRLQDIEQQRVQDSSEEHIQQQRLHDTKQQDIEQQRFQETREGIEQQRLQDAQHQNIDKQGQNQGEGSHYNEQTGEQNPTAGQQVVYLSEEEEPEYGKVWLSMFAPSSL